MTVKNCSLCKHLLFNKEDYEYCRKDCTDKSSWEEEDCIVEDRIENKGW